MHTRTQYYTRAHTHTDVHIHTQTRTNTHTDTCLGKQANWPGHAMVQTVADLRAADDVTAGVRVRPVVQRCQIQHERVVVWRPGLQEICYIDYDSQNEVL